MILRTAALTPTTRFDWRRVGALSTSFSAHLVAFALIMIPLTSPLQRSLQQAVEATLIEIPTPPALPTPPEPVPLRKPPPTSNTATSVKPAPTTPTPVAATTNTIATPISTEPAPVAATDISPPPTLSTSAGETRTLAYSGVLRPMYPAASVRAREQGTVLLRVLVDADGAVRRVEIERSSGHTKLDSAARDAVIRGRFRPVLRDGKAIPAWGLVPIEFRLDHG